MNEEKLRCSKCKKMLLVSEFHKNKSCTRGYAYQCRKCFLETSKQSYWKNRRKRLKAQRQHYQDNKETRQEYGRSYYWENKETMLEKRHRNYQEHQGERQEYGRKYYQEHKKDQERNEKRREKNRKIYYTLKGIFGNWKCRARRKGREFSIEFNDIEALFKQQQGKCVLTGLDLTLKKDNKYRRNPTNISPDRIDNSKGYILGNVQLVCVWANNARGELSIPEFKKFLKMSYKHLFPEETYGC